MGQAESSQGDSSAAHIGTSFHVLRVAENSPAADAGIDPFFDFLCGINGVPLTEEIEDLIQVIEQNEGRAIVLQVWSTKRRESRNVRLIPSRSWAVGATTSASATPSLLGLSMRLCDPKHALEQVWHVLEILEGSPAQSAGLVPLGDWIVGYAGGVLRGEGDFYDIVEAHVDKPLRLFVYNADYDVTREAILVPNRSWGGEGLLGCGVGYGLLHRIPKPQDRILPITEEEDEVYYEDEPEQQQQQYQQQYQNSNQNQQQQHQHQNQNQQQQQYQGGYQVDSNDQRTLAAGDSGNGRNGRSRREDSEGYEEVSYEEGGGGGGGEFGTSEGVEVIPSPSTTDDYYSTPPSTSFGNNMPPFKGSSPSTIPQIPQYRPPPISPSSFSSARFGVEQIQEEEE